MEDIIKKIYDYSLEDIMGQSFGRYSKYIIQDRAIPDVRDGLKPVQRRILYSMYKERNTYDKPTKKSANAVGLVMANYHPHGDSSIYEAIVRMSQWWKNEAPLIEMQGNNGSIDGDSPAASRYTEARLSKIAGELLRDIDKTGIVPMAPNYDDRLLEPTVLPSRFPNLLVNGTTGISAGYATNMPPHNLGEVIDATVFRIDNPNSRLDTVMNYIKGPDFPTGGIALGIDGIKKAYETGRGKIFIRAKTKIEKNKIIIDEIPYEVNKQLLVKRMDEIRIDKKIDGIVEVRDESDKDGLQIAVELKKDADANNILNYFYKNTDLQVSYNFNNVVIVNRRPMQLGLLGILDAYIAHQKEIVYKGTEYDLKTAKASYHIMEGLVKAISILDEVIALIRRSKNKADAIVNLVKEYDFTDKQAEAIVNLQLYRLTNTDITILNEKLDNLRKIIDELRLILSDENKLKAVIKEELRRIKKEYGMPRKTEIRSEVKEIKIDEKELIPREDVIVILTKDGYIKRVSLKSKSDEEDTLVKLGDYVISYYKTNTFNKLCIITAKGNYLYIPIHEIPVCKWKEIGKHVSNIVTIPSDDRVISSYVINEEQSNPIISIFTKNGMVKRCNLNDFIVSRYNKPYTAMKLKDDDEIVSTSLNKENAMIVTSDGYYLNYNVNEIPIVSPKAAGVKGINLKNDFVVLGTTYNDSDEYLDVFTNQKTAKRVKLKDLSFLSRAKRGSSLLKKVKSTKYEISFAFLTNSKVEIGYITGEDTNLLKNSDIPIMDVQSTGSVYTKLNISDVFVIKNMKNIDENSFVVKQEEKTNEELTIDNFIDDFKL